MKTPLLIKIQSFVQSHGFQASIFDGAVVFGIPYSIEGKHAGYEAQSVKSFAQARIALGY